VLLRVLRVLRVQRVLRVRVCCACCVRSWVWAWVWARAGGHGRARTCESRAYLRGLCLSSWPTRARRIAFSCSTEEGSEDEEEGGEVAEVGSEDEEEGGEVAEEGSEDEEGEEGELLAPPPLTTAVGTCGDG
jgi:hypothetical protein